MRGLQALTALNVRNGATVAEVAQEIRLPRTTTYRILETLQRSGYIYRDGGDDRYRLTLRVRGLAAGFDDEAWVTQVARPHLRALCDEIVWPVHIAAPCGTTMVVREHTDHLSPLVVERIAPGFQIPMLTSASGRAFLAYCPETQRESLLDILSRSSKEDDALAKNRPELERILDETRAQGYATCIWPRRVSDQVGISVPIMPEQDRVLASVTVRFSATAVPMKQALERFVPKLRETVDKIRENFAAQREAVPT